MYWEIWRMFVFLVNTIQFCENQWRSLFWYYFIFILSTLKSSLIIKPHFSYSKVIIMGKFASNIRLSWGFGWEGSQGLRPPTFRHIHAFRRLFMTRQSTVPSLSKFLFNQNSIDKSPDIHEKKLKGLGQALVKVTFRNIF